MKTKALALVLALCMVFAMLPATAFAARPMQALTPSGTPELMALPEEPVQTNGAYTITKSRTGPGVIQSYPADSADAGDEVLLLANPDPGYVALLDDHGLNLDLQYIGFDMYVFTMPARNVTLDFYFEAAEGTSHDITVNAPAECSWYLMDEVTSAKPLESVYLMLFSDDSYTFDPETAVSANCEDVYYLGTLDDEGDQHVYEIWMPNYDLTIDIEVTPVVKTYDVDMAVINRDMGFWSVESGKTAKAGDTVTIYAEPVAGCKVEEIYVQGGPAIKSIGNHRYTFTMPARNVLVYVTFAENINPVSVTVETGLGGTAYTNVSQAREYDTVTLTCEPQEGYRIARITGVDGLVDNSDNTYTFTMPGRAVDIQVLFLRENNPFVDVNETHFFYDSVLWAAEEGITSGISATEFGPGQACNRAQVVTFLWRYAGSPEPTSTVNPFTDVPAGSFCEKAVLWAAETGITSGISSTEFGPALTCNRVQVVTFLWRLMGEPETTLTENPFVDVDAGSWYEPAVLWALENGITTGTDATHFNPAGECIRAQVVTFLYRTAQLPTEPDPEPTEPDPEPVVTFTLDLRDNGSGRVAYVDGKTSAAPGESIFFYALPNEGFYLDHVGIFNPDGAIDVSTIQIEECGDGLYELIMIPHDLILTCYFYPIA